MSEQEKPCEEKSENTCQGCDHGPGQELHTCPFAEEIYGKEDLCNCCKDCEYQCAMDI